MRAWNMRSKIPRFFLLLGMGILIGGFYWLAVRPHGGADGLSSAELDRIHRMAALDALKMADWLDGQVVDIPAGWFWMGSQSGPEDERPMRRVYLDGFRIDRFEVTCAQYARFIQAGAEAAPAYWQGGEYPHGHADRPVVGVSWRQAQAYCAWAGKRLPSEAEWERACRGAYGRAYPWGEVWSAEAANLGVPQAGGWPEDLEDGWKLLERSGDAETAPMPMAVGSFPQDASAEGVYDLAGNAAEWVRDWYNWQGYADLPVINPLGGGPPWNHGVRGGAWFDRLGLESLAAEASRCAKRNSSHSYDDARIGFRCAAAAGASRR